MLGNDRPDVLRPPGDDRNVVVSGHTQDRVRSGARQAGIPLRFPDGDVVGGTVTHDAIRLFGPNEAVAGYLFACLSSEHGRRQLKARAFGSSIPHLDESTVAGVVLPKLDAPRMKALGLRAFAVRTARYEAIAKGGTWGDGMTSQVRP